MDLRKVQGLAGGPVRIGVLSPTTWQLVEKMAALFPEGIEVVGPLADNGHYWNDYRRKMQEWEELGLHVTLRLSPYHLIDFSVYDVLIESVETFSYSRDWLDQCHRLECPVLLKACWTRHPSDVIPASYFKRRRPFPVLLEMPAHARNWKAAGFRDVNVLVNPVGDWWFARAWSGEQERILFVLSGAKSWRGDPSWFGLDVWEEIRRAFPGRAHHHDGDVSYLTSREMTDLYGSSRVFVNLDRTYGQGERPLTLAFTEALSAGLPVVARDLPGLSFGRFIDSNGVCTNDVSLMCSFIEKCLSSREYAAERGGRSRQIALEHFSCQVLRPKYDELIERAKKVFERQKAEKDGGALRRAFAFLRRGVSADSSAAKPFVPRQGRTPRTGEGSNNLQEIPNHWRQRLHSHLASIQKAGGDYQYFELLRDHAVASGVPGNRANPEAFRAFPFARGSIDGDVIRTRVGSVQRRSFDAGIAEDQHVQDRFLFDFYCGETIPTDNTGVFEWLDICETVLAAKDTYTFVELGAGYARWSVIAYFLATRFRNLRTKLICVEPEPTHYRWAVQNFLDNGIRPRDHVLLEGAVSGKDGYVLFHVGDPAAWYGQSVVQELQPGLGERFLMGLGALRPRREPEGNDAERRRKCVKACSLVSLLEPVGCADLVHMDLQGSEYEALRGAVSVINEKVKRLHIGTHSPTIEARLQTLLGENGWTCSRNHPGQGRRATEFGEMDFEDGIQTWVNPRLAR
jgi:FkbM family methyltransferase